MHLFNNSLPPVFRVIIGNCTLLECDNRLWLYTNMTLDGLFMMSYDKLSDFIARFANHEKSKKHKENVAQLREEMLADEEGFDLSLSDSSEEPVEATPTRFVLYSTSVWIRSSD